MRLGVVGVPGKMSQRVVALAAKDQQLELGVAIARPGSAAVGQDVGAACGLAPLGVLVQEFDDALFKRADVWIEFAHASVTAQTANAAREAKKPLLVCTTGHDQAAMEAIGAASHFVPLMLAPNTSLGVAVLNAALRMALTALGPDYAAEIVELHHSKKRDAPSGTAMRLAETVMQQRGLTRSALRAGRDGMVGERGAEEIGVLAVRGGNVIGEHTVYLFGDNDRIELTHRAQDRDLFAAGALRAAKWLSKQQAGLYSIEDCLGLPSDRTTRKGAS